MYVFGCPRNFLESPTNILAIVGILVLAVVQISLLGAQDKWGSRFFIPKRLQPDFHDYHQAFLLESNDSEACAICMRDICLARDQFTEDEEGMLRNLEEFAENVLTTPCNHRFCRECLIRWMETKMICPTCRRQLPPYDF